MISSILNRHGSDKASAHAYGPIYDELLDPYRERARTVLELGVYGGASVRAWHEFFRNAVIIGVDHQLCTDARLPPAGRYVHKEVECKSPEALAQAMLELAPHLPLDIVIDDGCHERLVQVACFSILWTMVAPGGIYILEDVQTIEDAVEISNTFGGQVIDLRAVHGRSDDILVVWRKP